MLSRFLYDMANIILNLDVEGSVMIPSMGVGVPALFLNFGDPYQRTSIISHLLHLSNRIALEMKLGLSVKQIARL